MTKTRFLLSAFVCSSAAMLASGALGGGEAGVLAHEVRRTRMGTRSFMVLPVDSRQWASSAEENDF